MSSPDINLELLLKTINLEDINLNPVLEKNWILSFSGGADSVFALYILKEILKKFNLKEKKIIIYFLDHCDQIESDEIQRQEVIRFYQKSLALEFPDINLITFFPKRDLKTFCKKTGKNFEYVSSRMRYKHLNRLMRIHSNSLIITGHNMNDWVETLIMRLNRGADIWNLAPFSPIENFNDTTFFKPLVFLSAIKVREFCQKLNLKYWIDPSNYTGENYRSRLRNFNLITNEKGLVKTARNLVASKREIQKKYSSELEKFLPNLIETSKNREYRINYNIFNSINDELKNIVIDYILKKINCWPVSKRWREGILNADFHYKFFHVDKENWGNVLYLIIRRGRNKLNFNVPNVSKNNFHIINGKQVHKKNFIRFSYGRKSVLKLFNEKKLSSRQKENILLAADINNPLEIYSIFLSTFGLKDIHSKDYNLNLSL